MDSISNRCLHKHPNINFVLCYCLIVSSSFVLCLYLLVPKRVRQLPRSDPHQIKWRIVSVSFICLLWAAVLYPLIFCSSRQIASGDATVASNDKNFLLHAGTAAQYLGLSWNFGRDMRVLLHTSVLFLGPLVWCAFRIRYNGIRTERMDGQKTYSGVDYIRTRLNDLVRTFTALPSSVIWRFTRDLIVAPLSEEIVFRGCMVSPFLSAGQTPLFVTFVVPLFFGTAHIHHAVVNWRDGHPLTFVLMSTALQFSYTFLFGAYATYVFVWTRSIPAVYLSHAFCNLMGLPDLGFWNGNLNRWSKYAILFAYLMGIVLFVAGFYGDTIFDRENGLPSLFANNAN